jgi:hypothetical protein
MTPYLQHGHAGRGKLEFKTEKPYLTLFLLGMTVLPLRSSESTCRISREDSSPVTAELRSAAMLELAERSASAFWDGEERLWDMRLCSGKWKSFKFELLARRAFAQHRGKTNAIACCPPFQKRHLRATQGVVASGPDCPRTCCLPPPPAMLLH